MGGRYESGDTDHKVLGEKIHFPFSGLVAPSRFLKAAMTERISSWDQKDFSKRGIPSDELIRVYEEWGKGGFGVILTGNTMVNPLDIEAPGNPIVYQPYETKERLDAFRRQADAAKKHGSLVVMQASHAGRQVAEMLNPHPVSASDVQLGERMGMTFAKPRAMTSDEIKEVVDRFAYTAEFAHKTGYHGVELHGAHGYLLAQFLSASTNKRTDQYGGSLENRARIIYEIVEATRKRVPDKSFLIGIKLNSAEFQKGGFSPEECKDVCRHLEELGLDFVELSGGTYEHMAFSHQRDSTKKREAFFLEFADIIRPALTRTKVYVTGGFRTAAAMVDAVKQGTCDGVGLARPVTEEPDLPRKIINGEVKAARQPLLDSNDFGITNMAAGTQMRQIGFGSRPFNTTDEKEVADFKKLVGEFQATSQENSKEGIIKAGYPHFSGSAYGVSAS